MVGPCDIGILLVRMPNRREQPLGMAWGAGKVGSIVNHQHRATDLCGIAEAEKRSLEVVYEAI